MAAARELKQADAEFYAGKTLDDVKVGDFDLCFRSAAVDKKLKVKLLAGDFPQEPKCPSDCVKVAAICCQPELNLSSGCVSISVKTFCWASELSTGAVPVDIMKAENGQWIKFTSAFLNGAGVVEFFCGSIGILGVFLPRSSLGYINFPLSSSIMQGSDGTRAFALSLCDAAEQKIDNRLQIYDSNAKLRRSDDKLPAMLNDEVIVSDGDHEKTFVIDEQLIQKLREYLPFYGTTPATSGAKFYLTLQRPDNSIRRTVATREYVVPESSIADATDKSAATSRGGEVNFLGSVTADKAIFGADLVCIDERGPNASNTPPSYPKARECGSKPSKRKPRGTTNFKGSFQADTLIKDAEEVFIDKRTGPSSLKEKPGDEDEATNKNTTKKAERQTQNTGKLSSTVREAVQVQDKAVPMQNDCEKLAEDKTSQEESKVELDGAKEVKEERKSSKKDTGNEASGDTSRFDWRISVDIDLKHVLLSSVIVVLIAYICMI